MLLNLGASATGVIMLVLFGVFYWLGIFATIRAVLGFVGICLLGTAGFLGTALHAGAVAAAGLTSGVLGWAFGGGVIAGGLVLTVVTGIVFIHDLHPKNSAGKRTGWAGIALAALLVAGVSGVTALNNIPGQVGNGVTNAKTTFSNGG